MKRVDEDGDEWITDNSGEYRPLKQAEKDEARFIKGMFLFFIILGLGVFLGVASSGGFNG